MPLNILAAIAVKKVMEREHLSGHLQLWPGVAEELLGTKAYYVRAGMFKNVDVVLFCHVADNFGVSYGPRHRQRPGFHRIHRSRAKARTPPALPGAARARSTPSS